MNNQLSMSDIISLPDRTCGCGSIYFTQSFRIKQVSKFMTGGEEGEVPIPIWKCDNCGEVHDPLKQKENKTTNGKKKEGKIIQLHQGK